MDSIRKYVGGDAIQPKINKLGSKDWEKTKSKVKKNLREVAKDLIELYAKREKLQDIVLEKILHGRMNLRENFHIKKQRIN